MISRMVMIAAVALAVAASSDAVPPAWAAETKTLKEQLSDKASDNQRVDNCHVPPERRGPVVRPDCDGRQAPDPAAEPDRPAAAAGADSAAQSSVRR